MSKSIVRLLAPMALALGLALLPAGVAGQADVSGTWSMSVTTDNGVTTPSMTLEQNGAALTGRYSSETLGENPVTGTVDGNAVTIRFTANVQGQGIPVVYRGTVGDDGRITGSLDIADGMLSGTFTATRK